MTQLTKLRMRLASVSAWLRITHFGILALVLMFFGAVLIAWGVAFTPQWLFPIGLSMFAASLLWIVAGNKSNEVTPPAPVSPDCEPVEGDVPKGEVDPVSPPEDTGGESSTGGFGP